MFSLLSFTFYINILGLAFSQYFPPTPRDVTVVKSKLRKNVRVSFKEVNFLPIETDEMVISGTKTDNSGSSQGSARQHQE